MTEVVLWYGRIKKLIPYKLESSYLLSLILVVVVIKNIEDGSFRFTTTFLY